MIKKLPSMTSRVDNAFYVIRNQSNSIIISSLLLREALIHWQTSPVCAAGVMKKYIRSPVLPKGFRVNYSPPKGSGLLLNGSPD